MDNIRDMKKGDQIGRFMDTYAVRTSPFGRNISGEKAYSRAERLVSALHLLTSHVPHAEPAREMVRRVGLRLLSEILLLRDELRITNSAKNRAAQASIRELISLIRTLAISGFISFQNADVVIEALDELGNFLSASQRSALSENVVVKREDFLVGGYITDKASASSLLKRTQLVSQGQIKTPTPSVKDTTSVMDMVTKDRKVVHPKKINKTAKSEARTEGIIALLQASGELGIRDIASNLSEYSEKMIQRELANLVSKQLVQKIGVKRWSRYSLVA